MKCSICKNKIEKVDGYDNSHNAMPVNDGRCCDKCNKEVVIVKRFEVMGLGHPDDYIPIYIPEFPISLIKERDEDW